MHSSGSNSRSHPTEKGQMKRTDSASPQVTTMMGCRRPKRVWHGLIRRHCVHLLAADSIPKARFTRPTAAGLSDRAKRQNHNPETKKSRTRRLSSVVSAEPATTLVSWCGRRDSNSHTLRRWNLNPVCLPIPPHPHSIFKAKAPDYKSGASLNMGWTKGIEPSTTGVTIPCSTN